MKLFTIHAAGLRAAHIPPHAKRSTLPLMVTCKVCQSMKGISTMNDRDVRRMVSMVRAIRADKWTDELPPWAERLFLQEMVSDVSPLTKAVIVAEAFILLAHSSGLAFDETKFLHDAGLTA